MGFVFKETFWLLQWQKQPYKDGLFENNYLINKKCTGFLPVLESKFIKIMAMQSKRLK